MSTAALPAAPLEVRRDLHDGAGYTLTAPAPGVTALAVVDADGDTATPCFDRAAARQLVDDIMLVAGLKPTGATVDLATALEGSARILFQRIDDELERQDPAAADRIRAAMVEHLRSKCPVLVGGAL